MPDDVMSALGTWVDLIRSLVMDQQRSDASHVLPMLSETFGAMAGWTWVDADGILRNHHWGAPPGLLTEDRMHTWAEVLHLHPLVVWHDRSRDPRPMTIGRLPREIATPKRIDWTREVIGSPDVWQQLSMPIRSDAAGHGVFVLARGGRDFSPQHVELAARLQPLLMLLDRHTQELARLDERDSGLTTSGLTPRETTVLHLVAEGLTAGAIAHRLGCSPRTVQKHVEHAYRKLGVRDRLSAIRVLDTQRGAVVRARPVPSPRGLVSFELRLGPPARPALIGGHPTGR